MLMHLKSPRGLVDARSPLALTVRVGLAAAHHPPDPQRAIIDPMPILHMSEAEVARDLHAVLAKVQQGIEVVVEQDHRPVAVIKPSHPAGPGRKLSECIALAEAYEKKSGTLRSRTSTSLEMSKRA